jgi:hypothetical protein
MVDLGGERHRWCFERKILWKRKLEIKRASLVRAVRLRGYQSPRNGSENNAPLPL